MLIEFKDTQANIDTINERLKALKSLGLARLPTQGLFAPELNAEERLELMRAVAVAAYGTAPQPVVDFLAGRCSRLTITRPQRHDTPLRVREVAALPRQPATHRVDNITVTKVGTKVSVVCPVQCVQSLIN